jgi:hypothetical protein
MKIAGSMDKAERFNIREIMAKFQNSNKPISVPMTTTPSLTRASKVRVWSVPASHYGLVL